MVGMAKTKQKQKKVAEKATTKASVKETVKPVKEAAKPVKEVKEVVQPKKVEKKASEPRAPRKPKAATEKHVALATGRRKSSVARVFLKRGTGKLFVNEKDYAVYFDTEITQNSALLSMKAVPQAEHYDAHAHVEGGGLWGQADAVKLAVARALLKADESLKPALRELGLLTVDARVKERKKYGQKAARRRFQFVKR